MVVTARIEISTLKGCKMVRELAKYKKIVVFDNPLPLDDDGLPILTYSSEEVEDMVWDKLSGYYGVDVRKL